MLLLLLGPHQPRTLLCLSMRSSHQRREQRLLPLAGGIHEFSRRTCRSLSLWRVGIPLDVTRDSQCHPIPLWGQVLLFLHVWTSLLVPAEIKIRTLGRILLFQIQGGLGSVRMHAGKCGMDWGEGVDFEGLISDCYLSRGTVSSDENREMASAVIILTGT